MGEPITADSPFTDPWLSLDISLLVRMTSTFLNRKRHIQNKTLVMCDDGHDTSIH